MRRIPLNQSVPIELPEERLRYWIARLKQSDGDFAKLIRTLSKQSSMENDLTE